MNVTGFSREGFVLVHASLASQQRAVFESAFTQTVDVACPPMRDKQSLKKTLCSLKFLRPSAPAEKFRFKYPKGGIALVPADQHPMG